MVVEPTPEDVNEKRFGVAALQRAANLHDALRLVDDWTWQDGHFLRKPAPAAQLSAKLSLWLARGHGGGGAAAGLSARR